MLHKAISYAVLVDIFSELLQVEDNISTIREVALGSVPIGGVQLPSVTGELNRVVRGTQKVHVG